MQVRPFGSVLCDEGVDKRMFSRIKSLAAAAVLSIAPVMAGAVTFDSTLQTSAMSVGTPDSSTMTFS